MNVTLNQTVRVDPKAREGATVREALERSYQRLDAPLVVVEVDHPSVDPRGDAFCISDATRKVTVRLPNGEELETLGIALAPYTC